MSGTIDSLVAKILQFRDARDWKKFHTLQNLIASVSIEAAELLELTQWRTQDEIERFSSDPKHRECVEQECADLFIYLLLIADHVGFDLVDAASRKLVLNEKRYPADKSRGRAAKYTDL